jgi:hypothetical protein
VKKDGRDKSRCYQGISSELFCVAAIIREHLHDPRKDELNSPEAMHGLTARL